MSKIPEGATHTYTESSGTSFRKMSGSYWLGYADGDWIILNNPASHCYVPIQAEPEWTGEGLPPVGIECEWHSDSQTGWQVVKVLAYSGKDAWIKVKGKCPKTVGNPANFRTIRTPEQIAAEKRDAAIKEMQRLVGSCNTFPFAELYDYGYRLQVEK